MDLLLTSKLKLKGQLIQILRFTKKTIQKEKKVRF